MPKRALTMGGSCLRLVRGENQGDVRREYKEGT